MKWLAWLRDWYVMLVRGRREITMLRAQHAAAHNAVRTLAAGVASLRDVYPLWAGFVDQVGYLPNAQANATHEQKLEYYARVRVNHAIARAVDGLDNGMLAAFAQQLTALWGARAYSLIEQDYEWAVAALHAGRLRKPVPAHPWRDAPPGVAPRLD